MTKFLTFWNDPNCISDITFLLRFNVYKLVHFWKLVLTIARIWFYCNYAFFIAGPKLGISFNLLQFRNTSYKVLILSKCGQYYSIFYDKLIYTKALAVDISSGTCTSLFLLKSIDFKFSNFSNPKHIYFTKLFLILKTCRSARLAI